MMSRNHKETLRKQFLPIGSLLLILPLIAADEVDPQPQLVQTRLRQEVSSNPEVQVTQIDARRSAEDPRILQFSPAVDPRVQLLNERWEDMTEIHEEKTPSLGEGYATRYGPAAVSSLQLKTKGETFSMLQNPTENEQRIIELAVAVNAAQLEERFQLQSSEFAIAFAEILKQFGYDGVIAPKSPSDIGRVFEVQLWDPLTEQYTAPQRVIALDVSTGQTFYDKASQDYFFANHATADGQQVMQAWVGDISREVIDAVGIDTQEGQNTGVHLQWRESDSPLEADYPKYAVLEQPLTQEYQQFGTSLANTFNDPLSEETVANTINRFAEWPITTENQGLMTELPANSGIVPWVILNEQGVPTLLESSPDLYRSYLNAEEEVPVAWPFSFSAQWEFAERLYTHGILEKYIFTEDRMDDLPTGTNGVFFVEEMLGDYQSRTPLTTGVYNVTQEGVTLFYFDEPNTAFVQQSFEQADQILDRLEDPASEEFIPGRRIVFYGG